MSQDLDKKLEEYIKNSIDSFLNNNKETKTDIPNEKLTNIKKENTKDYNTILKFVVNNITNRTGLLIDNTMLNIYNKTVVDTLLDNIEASLMLIREQLK